MRRYSREAEETVQAQDLIWEWMRSGLLQKEQIPRLSEDLQTDLRRTNNFLRLVLFLFTAIIIGASVLLLIDILHITEDRARAMACVAAAALCFGLAECLVAKFRVYRFGVEEAIGVDAVGLVIAAVAQMMSNANIDSVLMSNANIDSVLAMALALGAIGGLLLYLRFGFVYAGVIAIACAAMIPFPLVHPVVVRHLLAAAILLVSFVVVRGNDLFQATAWVGLYVVLNLHIFPDAVNDRGWFYWTTYVMIWLLPILGLRLSLRSRDRLLMDVSGAMVIATLATNKLYLGLQPQTWDPILFGLFLMIAAVWIRRWLSSGTSGARFGFTPARILNRDSRLMTVVSTASAAFQPQASPSAPAVTETAKPQFAGGRSGGASGSGGF